jgi:hypothetical protein
MEKEILRKEFRFAHHMITDDNEDYHLIKELIHYKDGTKEPNIRLLKDFERPFWITKKHFRNHNQKKEYEEASKLQLFKSTQKDLANNIAAKLGMKGYNRNQYRDVLQSPYLYGSDVPSTAILSYMYKKQYPSESFTPFTVATLDIEADVDTSEITIVSSAIGNEIRVCVNKNLFINRAFLSFEKVKSDVIEKTRKHIDEKYKDINIIIDVYNTELECVVEIFKFIHSKQPDVLAIWNVTYDMKRMEETLRKYDVDPKEVFCDPNLPDKIKRYKFIRGKNKKVKADGTTTNIEYQDQWHIVKLSASFIVVDAMCTYAQIRQGQAKLTDGYGIDNVCKVNGVSQKLKIPGTIDPDTVSKRLWHRRMSNEFPIEYICYNIGDNTMMLDLDDKTSDLKVVLPTLLGDSHIDYFNSGPSRIIDKLFTTILEDGLILGTKPYKDDKDKLLGLDKWIVNLDATKIIYDTVKVA